MDRRRFVSVVLGGAAVPLVLSRAAWAKNGALVGAGAIVAADDVAAAYPCLRAGVRIGRWTVAEVLDPARGGVPVVLETAAGERFRVDVLRRDDATPGVANTSALGLYLCNQGDGRRATDEEHGLGALALGAALAKVDAGGTIPRLPLLTLRERDRRFPGAAFASLGGPATPGSVSKLG